MFNDVLHAQLVYGIGGAESVAYETWNNAITEILKRVRDPEGKMHSRDLAGDVLLECMRLVNLHGRLVLSSATMNTVAGQIFYPLEDQASAEAALAVGVREVNRDLQEIPWRNFLVIEEALNQRKSKSTVFANVGKDLLAIWPPKNVSGTVTLKYVKLLTKPVDLDTAVELAPEHMVEVLALAEQVLLARARAWEVLKMKLGQNES